MEDDIKEVVIRYISGREESLNKTEASEVFSSNRSDWARGKSNLVLLFEKKEPFLKIYREGHGLIFETNEGLKKFDSIEQMRNEENKYYETLYNLNVV